MELFERVKNIAHELAGSETKLAAILGLRQRQFNGYLNAVSQRNLWEHLPTIMEKFPQISRYWLYFGEGEMLDASYTPSVKETESPLAAALAEIVRLNQENRELRAKLDEKDGK